MKKLTLLLFVIFSVLLLTCKKKSVEELSLDDILKQQEEYYRSLPDWEKLRYKGRNQALLKYGMKGKIKNFDEKRVNRPTGGWNPNATDISVWEKHYEFDREGRILKFEYVESINNKQEIKEDSTVRLIGDTIVEIKATQDYGNSQRTTQFFYFPFGNFQKVTHLTLLKEDVSGTIQSTYSRYDVIYTYDKPNVISNRRWLTFRPESTNFNNTEYLQSIDTTFNTKGYAVESHEVEYHRGITPNDTFKIIRKEFQYNSKNQLLKVVVDDVTEDYITPPEQVNTIQPQINNKVLTPQSKTEYKNYDKYGNWEEQWVYENGVVPNDPTYKIYRYDQKYYE